MEQMHSTRSTAYGPSPKLEVGDARSKSEQPHEDFDSNKERANFNRQGLTGCVFLPGGERLRLLNYQSNFISSIENMDNLRNLVILDLYNNNIEKIGGIDNLVNLRVLMLGRNRIQRIENLHFTPRLDVLDLHSNLIKKIENISSLTELRVLNLEDNKITHMENLPSSSLVELNLKRNNVIAVNNSQSLFNLRRLILSGNQINGFEQISDLLMSSSIVELSLDSNAICSDHYYRAILINRIKTLKYLDGKRVAEDERRLAARIAKREADRRKENDRVVLLSEERARAIARVKAHWDREVIQLGGQSIKKPKATPDKDSATGSSSARIKRAIISGEEGIISDSSTSFLFIQNGRLSIFGNALSCLDRIDPPTSLCLEQNNIQSLRQLQCLESMRTMKKIALSILHNRIVKSSLFFNFVINVVGPSLRSLNSVDVTEEMYFMAQKRFAAVARKSTQSDSVSATEDVCAVSKGMKLFANSHVSELVKSTIDKLAQNEEFDRQFFAMVTRTVSSTTEAFSR
ncbi:hypothetical protein DFJ73DRAFT_341434 [Zopfochytrium polystomum]|nr:hypothetical protein DFJ73DRAFT_341434 [Zopfochytrium polystomum]